MFSIGIWTTEVDTGFWCQSYKQHSPVSTPRIVGGCKNSHLPGHECETESEDKSTEYNDRPQGVSQAAGWPEQFDICIAAPAQNRKYKTFQCFQCVTSHEWKFFLETLWKWAAAELSWLGLQGCSALLYHFRLPDVCSSASWDRDWTRWLLLEESISAREKYERTEGEGKYFHGALAYFHYISITIQKQIQKLFSARTQSKLQFLQALGCHFTWKRIIKKKNIFCIIRYYFLYQYYRRICNDNKKYSHRKWSIDSLLKTRRGEF